VSAIVDASDELLYLGRPASPPPRPAAPPPTSLRALARKAIGLCDDYDTARSSALTLASRPADLRGCRAFPQVTA
jgi:hypothetical protein